MQMEPSMMKRPTHEKHPARKLASIVLLSATILAAFVAPTASGAESVEQVLFVCEHGNVKSLMAASYFNQLAAERKLPLRAISRGVSLNSKSVPPAIVAELHSEGIEVSGYRPVAFSANDASQSRHVVTIGTDLPASAHSAATTRERWDDVPAASKNYAAARDSLRAHVRDLIQRLSNQASP
jgi:arsenate reductase (thioredoxin)